MIYKKYDISKIIIYEVRNEEGIGIDTALTLNEAKQSVDEEIKSRKVVYKELAGVEQ